MPLEESSRQWEGVTMVFITQCTSRFSTQVCSHLSTYHRLSTGFHPQTDGQTLCQNQTLDQYLPTFCNYAQDNWVKLLPLNKFIFHNAIHASTLMTPFWVNYHFHPVTQFKDTNQPSILNSDIQVDAFAAGLEATTQTFRK
jgi:hypothetical protein